MVTITSTKKMTIMNKPYEPIMVESTLSIEKEIDEDQITEYQEKVDKLVLADLKRQAENTLKEQQKVRNRMSAILRED